MSQDNDFLSKDYSPQKLQKFGVKRVNNIPLIIAMGILIVFILLIVLVAQKRANAQNKPNEIAKIKTSKKTSLSLANEVIENASKPLIHTETEIPQVNQENSLPKPQNSTQTVETVSENMNDAEIERIRQEKTQAFEEAVKTKSAITIDNTRLNNKDSIKVLMNADDVSADTSISFKEQLKLLQTKIKPMPQTLGGEEDESRWHLNSKLQKPNSRFELRAGSVIPGVMISGISSELPGQIIGQVSQNVFDTATGKNLIIPQGTKILGIYSSDVSFGQNSVMIAWQRLVFPDGKALDIGSMPGADSAGFDGFRDQVDHHYGRIYGSALLMSGIVAGISYSQNINQSNPFSYGQPTAGSVMSQALGEQLGEVTTQLVAKNLNTSPTINIRPGYRFNIIVVKDLTFKKPYRAFS